MIRVYQDQSHQHYNVALSTYVILSRLNLLRFDDSLMIMMQMRRWDNWLCEWLEHPLVRSPEEAMCILIQQIFNALKLPLTPNATNRMDNQIITNPD